MSTGMMTADEPEGGKQTYPIRDLNLILVGHSSKPQTYSLIGWLAFTTKHMSIFASSGLIGHRV